MLFNINTLTWDEEILAELDIPALHAARRSGPAAAFTARRDPSFFGAPIPIAGAAGDQQAALFGQTCFAARRGQEHLRHRLFPADEHRGEARVLRKRPGDHHCLGLGRTRSTTRWRAPSLWRGRRSSGCGTRCGSLIPPPTREYMASKVPDTNGCYVVPAFTGLGAPHWDQYARGAIVGLTRGVNKYHIIRATLDSLCLPDQRRAARPWRPIPASGWRR